MITLYGINNCDTIRKARRWLQTQQIDFIFHDFRKQGLEQSLLESWIDELGWEVLINRRGTTWRQLPDEKKAISQRSEAITLLLEYPAIIKRPVLDLGNSRKIGFKEADYQAYFEQ